MIIPPPGLPIFPLLQLHYLTSLNINRVLSLAHCPITREEFILLREIQREHGLSQTTLGQRMGKDRNNLSRSCSALEEKGILQRLVREEDRRHYILELTPYGEAVFKRADVALQHYRSLTHKNYTTEDWEKFKQNMEIFYISLMSIKELSDDELLPDETLRKPLESKPQKAKNKSQKARHFGEEYDF